MSNFMYYGEMVARISAYLHNRPEHRQPPEETIEIGHRPPRNFWALCADAAKIFKQVEDLCDDIQIDWHLAVEGYARELDSFLQNGQEPNVLELYQMTARSIAKCSVTQPSL